MPQTGLKAARETTAAVELVLFDLDGTLVDSAPDLAGTANDMLRARGLAPVPYDRLRSHCGSGARGMLGCAFKTDPRQAGYGALRDEFLDRYEQRMLQQTRIFDSALPMLAALDAAGMAWGIVTNKALRFATPLTRELGLLDRAKVLIGGDSTAHTKPHPEPLLEAARQVGRPHATCIYVGDDERDMLAGRAAGMATAAAAWGYLGADAALTTWQADVVLDHPMQLLHWLDLA
ncbi:MAG: phosphoglycolate phosphatase [Rubrivivax sp.]